MASRSDDNALPREKRPSRSRGPRRGFEPYVPPKRPAEAESQQQGQGRGFLDDVDLPCASDARSYASQAQAREPQQQQPAAQPASKSAKGKHKKKRSPPPDRDRQGQRTPPRTTHQTEQNQWQEMEARIKKQVEEQVAEKLARATVLSTLFQQHKQDQQLQHTEETREQNLTQKRNKSKRHPRQSPEHEGVPNAGMSASDRAFQKARDQHAQQQEAVKAAKHQPRAPPSTSRPSARSSQHDLVAASQGTAAGGAAATTRAQIGAQAPMISMEDSIKKALQSIRHNPGMWQDFCVLGPSQTAPEYTQIKRDLLQLYVRFMSSDPVAASEAHVAARIWVMQRKELDLFSDALRELKRGKNPFAQVTNRGSRNANAMADESNGLTVDDLQVASRKGFLAAVDAASGSLAEVLTAITDIETEWHAAASLPGVGLTAEDGVWLMSVRNTKQVILTAMGDLVRYHSRMRADTSGMDGQGRPGSADNNYAMRYYAQAKLDAPWSGRVLQHMGKLHFTNRDVFDAVECFARSMCVHEPYAARESLLEVFEQCRQQVETISAVTALSGLSFRDHSARFRAHFLACAGIAFTRTGADKFASYLDRCRRHLSTMIQMLPIVTNAAQHRATGASQTKTKFYDFVGPSSRDSQHNSEEIDALSAHRHFQTLEEDCYKAVLICISLLTVVLDKHHEAFEQTDVHLEHGDEKAFAVRFHAVRVIPGLTDIVRMLFSISAALVGADGTIRDFGWEPVVAKAVCLLLSFLTQNLRFSAIQLLDEPGWQAFQAAIVPYMMSLPRSSRARGDAILPEDDDLEGFEPVNASILKRKYQAATAQDPPEEMAFDNATLLFACSTVRSKQAEGVVATTIRAARCRHDLKLLSSSCVEYAGFFFDKEKRPITRPPHDNDNVLHIIEAPDSSVPLMASGTRQSQKLLSREEFMQALENFPVGIDPTDGPEQVISDQESDNASDDDQEQDNQAIVPVEDEDDEEELVETEQREEHEEAESPTNSDAEAGSGDDEGKESGEITELADLASDFAELTTTSETACAGTATKGGLLVGVNVQAIRERQAQSTNDNDSKANSPSHVGRSGQSKSPNHKAARPPRQDRRGQYGDRTIPLPLSLPRHASEDLPLIVIDAPNVAMRHGMKQTFSCRGIQLAINFFRMAGHEVVSFLPDYYLDFERIGELRRLAKLGIGEVRAAQIPDDIPLLQELVSQGAVVGTPPQDYDDSYCITYARHKGGYVVTNDMYRDHVKRVELRKERDALHKWIKQHCISYTFVRDEFVPNPDFDFKR